MDGYEYFYDFDGLHSSTICKYIIDNNFDGSSIVKESLQLWNLYKFFLIC